MRDVASTPHPPLPTGRSLQGFIGKSVSCAFWLGPRNDALRLAVSPPYPITNVQCRVHMSNSTRRRKKSKSESESLGILSVSSTSKSTANENKGKPAGSNVSQGYENVWNYSPERKKQVAAPSRLFNMSRSNLPRRQPESRSADRHRLGL